MNLPRIVLMLVKRAAYYVMAAGPILLLGLIAINSRTSTSTWQFVEYTPETDQHLKAYIYPLAKAEHLEADERPAGDDETLKTIATWLAAYRAGVLQEIPPATTTMEIDSGVYKQVMDARTYLLGRAKRHADELAKAGEYDRAAEAYMDAIELGYIAKYSEFGIMTESAAKQSRFVIGIEKILPHVSEEGRQDILARLNRLDLGQKSFAYVVDHYAGAYQKDLHRLGQPNSLIEAARDTKYVASAATDDQVRIDRWEAVTLADRDLLPLFGSGRVAQTSERDYVARLSTLIHDLQPAPTTWN